MIAVRKAKAEDLVEIDKDIRIEDRLESLLFTGKHIKSALKNALDLSSEAYVVTLNEQPVLLFGVAPMENGSGSVWLRATNQIHAVSLFARKEARKYLDKWKQQYPGGLYAAAMQENNDTHLRWLSVVGFTHITTIPVNQTSFMVMAYV